MSRTTVFIILGTIMLALVVIAIFKLDQDFSIISKKEKQKSINEKATPKQTLPNVLEKNPFTPPKIQTLEQVPSKDIPIKTHDNLNQQKLADDEIFVWVTETPTITKPNEKAITQVKLTIEDKELSFRMVAAEDIKTRTMFLQDPDRFVIDIHGNWIASLPPIPAGNPWLEKIRTGYNDGSTRFVLELKKTPTSTESTQPKKNIIEVQVQ